MIRFGFALTFLATIATAATALGHGGPSLLGFCAGCVFLGIAIASGAIAMSLNFPNDVTEPRHPPKTSSSDDLTAHDKVIPRGALFGRLWAMTGGALLVVALIPIVALRRGRARTASAPWTRGTRLVTPTGHALRADDVAIGGVETVFPEGAVGMPEAAVMLIRLDEHDIHAGADRAGWSPGGNIAYSKICTHAGCPVALYRRESRELCCPCHQSVFDVTDGAKPKSGPAPRALPQLALAVDHDGFLIAQGEFSGPIGPDEWDHPIT